MNALRDAVAAEVARMTAARKPAGQNNLGAILKDLGTRLAALPRDPSATTARTEPRGATADECRALSASVNRELARQRRG